MPKIYSDDLCDIIRSMLGQDPEKRPSVARLLRHSFIKKQIALFLEGTKNRWVDIIGWLNKYWVAVYVAQDENLDEDTWFANCFTRQKKNLKAKEAQVSTSESSKTSDSGYSGMDSREDPKTSDSARSKPSGNNEREQRRKTSDVNSNDEAVKQKNEDQFVPRNKVPSHEERQAKEINKRSEQKSHHDGRKSQEGREDDGRPESSDRQVSLINNIMKLSRIYQKTSSKKRAVMVL